MAKISINNSKEKGTVKRLRVTKKGDKAGESKIKVTKNEIKTKKKKRSFRRKPGPTIYIGHIPHGFYENEMTSYFGQFGKVLGATVARSKKTGQSKGYGFVEFQNEDVAKIAAETMNNYLMFSKIVKCRYIPPEERKGRLQLRTIDPKNCPRKQNQRVNAEKKKNALSKLNQEIYLKKTQKKIDTLQQFFKDKGIDFTFQLNDDKNESSNIHSASNISLNSESEEEADSEFGVLEIDESDNDIHFKTPPQVKKVFKRSLDSPLTPPKRLSNKSTTKGESLRKTKKLKSSSKEAKKKEGPKKKSNVNKTKLLSVKVPQVKTSQKKSGVISPGVGKSSKKNKSQEMISSKKGRVATKKQK